MISMLWISKHCSLEEAQNGHQRYASYYAYILFYPIVSHKKTSDRSSSPSILTFFLLQDIQRIQGLGAAPAKVHDHIEKTESLSSSMYTQEIQRLKQSQEVTLPDLTRLQTYSWLLP